jgi:class 3 adenylate cyclase
MHKHKTTTSLLDSTGILAIVPRYAMQQAGAGTGTFLPFLLKGKNRLTDYLDEGRQGCNTKPMADLFPETTIMFADIVGFTAWSSSKEPSQVFTLLETIYQAFDDIARRRRVFKVETIEDCYVAVCGLPAPRKDHAIVRARFSHEETGDHAWP